MELEKVSRESFRSWMRDPVTKGIFAELKAVRAGYNERLTDANHIMGDQLNLAKWLGKREGLDILLQIEAVDFSTEETEDDL